MDNKDLSSVAEILKFSLLKAISRDMSFCHSTCTSAYSAVCMHKFLHGSFTVSIYVELVHCYIKFDSAQFIFHHFIDDCWEWMNQQSVYPLFCTSNEYKKCICLAVMLIWTVISTLYNNTCQW